MESIEHKGTELNNVQETWNQNEKLLREGAGATPPPEGDTAPTSDLEQVIKQEAADYDDANKEDRLIGGERATVNDEDEA